MSTFYRGPALFLASLLSLAGCTAQTTSETDVPSARGKADHADPSQARPFQGAHATRGMELQGSRTGRLVFAMPDEWQQRRQENDTVEAWLTAYVDGTASAPARLPIHYEAGRGSYVSDPLELTVKAQVTGELEGTRGADSEQARPTQIEQRLTWSAGDAPGATGPDTEGRAGPLGSLEIVPAENGVHLQAPAESIPSLSDLQQSLPFEATASFEDRTTASTLEYISGRSGQFSGLRTAEPLDVVFEVHLLGSIAGNDVTQTFRLVPGSNAMIVMDDRCLSDRIALIRAARLAFMDGDRTMGDFSHGSVTHGLPNDDFDLNGDGIQDALVNPGLQHSAGNVRRMAFRAAIADMAERTCFQPAGRLGSLATVEMLDSSTNGMRDLQGLNKHGCTGTLHTYAFDGDRYAASTSVECGCPAARGGEGIAEACASLF